ncbi:NAD-dependent epimerase/dehydratase [Crepidotus variabilis]|uniref:NAD-dependent epimerase/dehydratase n=1 Tax=Crepidotus variabilis TaxID=179855 RepID=A0A9P6JN36_9AGAR|nr:NAD-dependent epimerase/dehydratase [Crepidotus variabilis]
MNSITKKVVLITGGHGFIGSHVARELYTSGEYYIRIVDVNLKPAHDKPLCHEFFHGDLCDDTLCRSLVRGVDIILHFAANMGGMGTIHAANDFTIYDQNHRMTLNLVEAAIQAGVQLFFYASSACVYPESLQNDPTNTTSLRESDVWANPPPKPQGLYGLEKLVSELLLAQLPHKMEVRIARFHNVYGPGGAWNDGREKAPAAMLRKAIALKSSLDHSKSFEIWGDGQCKRSFLYIDDAVDGVVKLLNSSEQNPVNIGSDSAITIQDLAHLALKCFDIDPGALIFAYDATKPTGVSSRNSNNDLVSTLLDWRPTTSLEEGMRRTGVWIQQQVSEALVSHDQENQLFTSKLLHLKSQDVVFALLLPITSRGSNKPDDCLKHLRNFAKSLTRTTWRDVHEKNAARYRFVIYLAIDYDDTFLISEGPDNSLPQQVLQEDGLFDIVTLVCKHPRGHVCKIWKECAKRAFEDGCDYFVLLGDDVVLKDEGWMRDAHAAFKQLSATTRTPFGFGCVAFTDLTFPGMPTFPIVHRIHMEIFKGEIIPDAFINQDGDPFLFQLYRRWGCSMMFSSRLSNGIGGGDDCRYEKKHAEDWTFEVLDSATDSAEAWLLTSVDNPIQKKLTLDVVIPCYRVDLTVLNTMLSLKSSPTCSTMFIVIIDNPLSPHIFELESRYAHRPDIRIRINKTNVGASASRNRGMEESAADWVHFLDDDVVPDEDLLIKAEEIIRAHPRAAGFVGNSIFPTANTVFTTAVHVASLTYFWDIASKMKDNVDLPWGVTANLIARRNIPDGVKFDLMYPKTGGGEDIDFCIRKRDYVVHNTENGEGFVAAPLVQVTHPWWNNGKRSYWRFFNWSVGDGALVKQFPQHVYHGYAPNAAECLLLSVMAAVLGASCAQWNIVMASLKVFGLVLSANMLHDTFRHLYLHPERDVVINSSLNGFYWVLAIFESTLIRVFSEVGRVWGLVQRGDYGYLGYRFDWFTGRLDGVRAEERRRNTECILITLVLAFVVLS